MKMRGSDAGNPRNKTKTNAAVEEDKVLTLFPVQEFQGLLLLRDGDTLPFLLRAALSLPGPFSWAPVLSPVWMPCLRLGWLCSQYLAHKKGKDRPP